MKAILFALMGLALPRVLWAEDLPRYKLPVGRQLSYTGGLESAGETPTSHTEMTFTVASQNADGTSRLIIRESIHFGGSERNIFGYADVFPDGRFKPNSTIGPQMSIDSLIPQLPATEDQTKSQWQTHVDYDQGTIMYQPIKDSDSEFTFSATYDGPMNHIYVSTQKVTFHFDRAKGMISESDAEVSQDYGFHSKASGPMKLVKDEMLDPEKAAQLGKDGMALCTANEQYLDCLQQIADDPASAQKLCDQAKDLLQDAEKNVKSDDVRAELDHMLKQHDAYAGSEIEDAKKELEILNKPAKVWVATDLDGKKWSLDELRGKVVVMDFWYRGCGWCMYATPQVKQLAEDYKGKDVVVLGMNTDENESDARFVVKEFGLTYPQLKARLIPQLYNIHGFPTLLIVDQQGVVRGIHVGYSRTLHDEVGKKIDALLKKSG